MAENYWRKIQNLASENIRRSGFLGREEVLQGEFDRL
jgi:hypothetical protein